jgi:hypothetical protein
MCPTLPLARASAAAVSRLEASKAVAKIIIIRLITNLL